MHKTKRILLKKIMNSGTAIVVMVTMICGLTTSVLATEFGEATESYDAEIAEIESMVDAGEISTSDTFLSLDEEGNIELIPLDEVETPDEEVYEVLDELEEAEYYVIGEVDGVEEIIEVTDTLEEAEQIIEEIQAEVESEVAESEESTEASAGIFSMFTSILPVVGTDDFSITAVAADSSLDATTLRTSKAVSSTVSNAVVVFISQDANNDTYIDNVTYTNADTGASGYINPAYGPDAAYLGLVNGKVKFMQSGVVGLVDAEYVNVVSYEDYTASKMITSVYTTSSGKLYHKITTNITSYAATVQVGYQQDYMSSNATYYSFDGHYFYTSYSTMISDYQAGTYKNSINASEPYYNYFQYLSQRTETNFTADQIDEYIEYKHSTSSYSSKSSVMFDTGEYFIEYQDTYGANAILMLGVALSESAYGTSTIATTKNNLFGHGAVDSNPYYGASGYTTVADSIKYHAEYYVSMGYCDTKDYRYYGPHLGNKESGMSVKYASDPYWGEKNAAHGYYMENYFSSDTYDYGAYTIGISSGTVYAYNEPGGTSIYNTTTTSGTATVEIGFVILDTVTVSGVTWYKVQSDSVLNSSRTSAVTSYGEYDFDNCYVYVKASNIDIVYEGTGGTSDDSSNGSTGDSSNGSTGDSSNGSTGDSSDGSTGDSSSGSTGDSSNDSSGETVTSVIGDVDNNGKREVWDYVLIQLYLMDLGTLSTTEMKKADVDGNSKVEVWDYVLIQLDLMGLDKLD